MHLKLPRCNFNPLSANPFSVFDYFVGLALQGLITRLILDEIYSLRGLNEIEVDSFTVISHGLANDLNPYRLSP